MIKVRQERAEDAARVYEIVKTAFATAEHSDGTEQDLVTRLHGSAAFIPELSLVAESGDEIVGYILFTELELGDVRALALAPLAVLPEYQGQGVGTLLLNEGHRIAKALDYEISVVVGSERYYPRVGYVPASSLGITAPFEVPEKNLMAINLQGKETKPNCMMEYAKELFV